MDHEYDARAEDDGTNKTDQGLDSPPNGPSAAHFREAARLAAARARKALEDNDGEITAPPKDAIVSEDFKKAATKHARTMNGRGKRTGRKMTDKSVETAPAQSDQAEDSIALLDERLHLGARMLRAFESQIQRLQDAGANETTDMEAAEAEIATRVEETLTRFENCFSRAQQIEKSLESLIRRAEEVASGLGNGIEICNAIQSSTQDRAREIAELEDAQQQRGDAIIQGTRAALTRMEETLESARAMEVALTARVEALPKPESSGGGTRQDPPVIEIHARNPPSRNTQVETTDAGTTGEQFSVGTLSVEPGRARTDTRTP